MPFVLVALSLIVIFLLLRLRLRLILSDHQRIVFAGLGRSGPEIDFIAKRGVIKIFGIRIKSFSLEGDEKKKPPSPVEPLEPEAEGTTITPVPPSPPPPGAEKVARAQERARLKADAKARAKRERDELKDKERKPSRRATWRDIGKVFLESREALWNFVRGLLRGLIVEELYGEVRAGFESPDLTGEAYGFYYALMASVPEAHRHLRFYPDWLGPSFAGSLRLSIALPLYKLLWRTMVLLFQLPLKRIRSVVIKRQRGVSHA